MSPAAQVPRRVAVPFLLALSGVLVAVGLVVDRAAGRATTAAYAVVVCAAILVGAVAARRQARAARLAAGRTCTCCTGTVHDPVEVV